MTDRSWNETLKLPGSGGRNGIGRPRIASSLLLLLIVTFFVVAGVWASYASLEEVTTGEGKIIPSGHVKTVQNLEGGIISELLVKEGEHVEEGQVLVRIDDTSFAGNYGELRAEYLSLLATIARLEAEILGGKPQFPPAVLTERPSLADSAEALLSARRAELESSLDVLRRQVDQRVQEFAEAESRLAQTERSYAMAHEELELMAPLVEQGVISKVELLRLQRQVNDLKGDMEATELSLPRLLNALNEAERRVEERQIAAQAETLTELTAAKNRLAQVEEVLVAEADRLKRREVLASVSGIVKQINISTIGGVVQLGEELMEIVPLDETLLVEARIDPKDVAFLSPGQPATVKISAYDYSIYGGLDATLTHISADTILDEEGRAYYQIRARTELAYLGTDENPLPITPGMTATVDVLTGEKTVMDYILKPILKAKQTALRER